MLQRLLLWSQEPCQRDETVGLLETLEQGAEDSALRVRLKLPNKILVLCFFRCPLFSVVSVRLSVKRVKPNLGLSISS